MGTLDVYVPNVSTSSDEYDDGIRGVHIGPGATVFTLIPFENKFLDKYLVKDVIAPLLDL